MSRKSIFFNWISCKEKFKLRMRKSKSGRQQSFKVDFLEYTHWEERGPEIFQAQRKATVEVRKTNDGGIDGYVGYWNIYDLSYPAGKPIYTDARWIQYVADDGRLWLGYLQGIIIFDPDAGIDTGPIIGWRHCIRPYNNLNPANHLQEYIKLSWDNNDRFRVDLQDYSVKTGPKTFIYTKF